MFNHSAFNRDLDELIFAHKNKAYGAYILRQTYRVRISLAMWISVILFILATFIPFIFILLSAGKNISSNRTRVVEVVQLSEPPSIDIKNHIRPAEITESVRSIKNSTPPVVKSDELVTDDSFPAADTVGLENIYSESTLNVQIKYPYGWTFLDQNVKNRLDGVTFWGSTNLYKPPPYIHLEVMDKSLFNPSRFKYKSDFNNYTIYYNDPEELSDQFTRLIYIRTETDVDYSLKLIMKGKEQFENFEPVFFGMLKTFSFGD